MGSSLGTVFANIIMTDLERVIAEPLITSGEIRLYIWYVNDNLLLAKEEDNDIPRASSEAQGPGMRKRPSGARRWGLVAISINVGTSLRNPRPITPK